MACISAEPYGGTSILCRMRSGIARSQHDTEVPDKGGHEAVRHQEALKSDAKVSLDKLGHNIGGYLDKSVEGRRANLFGNRFNSVPYVVFSDVR